MSSENVQLVRAGFEAFLRGDVQGALALADPDVVAWRAPPLPDSRTYHGPGGVLEMYADWTADFDDFEMWTGEYIDTGDRVIVETFQRGTGKTSGAEVVGKFWFAYTVADGKLTRQDVYNSKQQALDGVAEPPP